MAKTKMGSSILVLFQIIFKNLLTSLFIYDNIVSKTIL